MLVKGIEPWFLWFHTNVLAIKLPHHIVKQYDTKWILNVSMKFFIDVYNNIWTSIFFVNRFVGT
jgi:hypothetical protein